MNRADECNGRCEDGSGGVLKMKISVAQFRRPLIFIRLTSLEALNPTFYYYFCCVTGVTSFNAQFKVSHSLCYLH